MKLSTKSDSGLCAMTALPGDGARPIPDCGTRAARQESWQAGVRCLVGRCEDCGKKVKLLQDHDIAEKVIAKT